MWHAASKRFAITGLYEDDEYSRMLPGAKDKVRIQRGHYHQKRLLLCTVKELYAACKLKYPCTEVDFLDFLSLNQKGVLHLAPLEHIECVCSIHQNGVLLADACNMSYREMMSAMVCDINNKICMVHCCSDCPAEEALLELLRKLFEEINNDFIQFQQYESTDRARIVTMSLPVDDFIENVAKKISDLTAHSFISKSQSQYLKRRKELLGKNEAIALLDFAENYQFVIQDEIQSYHWSKEYCTKHPVVVYFKQNHQLIEKSFCFLSDNVEHDTSFVWKLQQKLTEYIRNNFSNIKFIEYFSDGCAGQYENFKNFLNLIHHQLDFNLAASWSVIATSHGKSPCDGIGEVVKCKLSRVSLTRETTNPFLTSLSTYECCQQEFNSIIFFNVDKSGLVCAR